MVNPRAWRIAQSGSLYHQVSSMVRAVREVRRTDQVSILGPSMPKIEGRTVTESSAARPTAEMEP